MKSLWKLWKQRIFSCVISQRYLVVIFHGSKHALVSCFLSNFISCCHFITILNQIPIKYKHPLMSSPAEIETSAWIRESQLNWYERLAVNVVRVGSVPRHVAFIMDGNRRFANKSHIAKREGHARGFDKLSETLQWCLDLGITQVTVYAFSIENFKRSSDEVESLMSLAREKFQKLLDERDKLHERGICIRIIGNLSLLPQDILKTMAEAVLLTKDNKTAILNVAFAYTSRDEMTNGMKTVIEGVKKDEIEVDDINEALFNECLYTNKSANPDLLVRTSGEVRFSDFLLWQVSIYLYSSNDLY